ncbi:GNAT family N-acetyltransferase [Lacticaseibacillus parakribbianus]|uniref:GNAT family N-acetyltransferase n=1 Tax=Lacticaseibacillus parakribbianus TaxID=2970927 RepID=UPI0021CB49C2|nr:GNAT family N-acetyltransferase [Lacticaseibacillus parakribbianus]
MTLKLKPLNLADSRAEYDFFQAMPEQNGFEVPYRGLSYAAFTATAIPQRLTAAAGQGLPAGYVPDTYFFLWDDARLVGLFKVRHHLNAFLRQGSGHIGYGILPAWRGRGYATRGLALALAECRRLMPPGETEIYLSCLTTNAPSLAAMLANGGRVVATVAGEHHVRIAR